MVPSQTGYVANSFDHRDVWADELMAGSTEQLPTSFSTRNIPFERQGAFPFCVSFATCKLVALSEVNAGGSYPKLSQPFQFFHSNGQVWGSTFRDNLNTVIGLGVVPAPNCPMPTNVDDLSQYEALNSEALAASTIGSQTVPGYVRINPNTDDMKRAIIQYGGILAGVVADGHYWNDGEHRPVGRDTNHGIILSGWRTDNCWEIHDSLEREAGFDGYHYLAADYEFDSPYAVGAMVANWRDVRNQARTPPPNNANYYGMKRNLASEQIFANQLLVEFHKFNNQSVLDAAGRFWLLYIRAGVYGGYTFTDLVNDCYAWRRSNQHLFNFDTVK